MSQHCNRPQAFLGACRSGGNVKTKLDKLINSIDPSRTIDLESARADSALNSFLAKHKDLNTIHKRDDFRTFMANYYCYMENQIFHINPPRKPCSNFDWYRCENLLQNKYGTNCENVAFDMARTGIGGGLYAVLKVVCDGMADEFANNYIGSLVSDFWDSLSGKEKVAISKEYLDKYGHLIPSELMEGGAVRVRAFFGKVLEEHPNIVRRLRNVNRGT